MVFLSAPFTTTALLLSSSIGAAHAFSPAFSAPRQCSPLSFSWSSSMIHSLLPSAPSYSISFVPLASSRNVGSAPPHSPVTVDVPCHPLGKENANQEYVLPSLPFQSGTQFYAEVHVPGVKGVISRRRVSDIFTVEPHPTGDISCLASILLIPSPSKWFGKRQVNVVGPSFIDINASGPTPGSIVPPANAGDAPPVADAGAVPLFREVGLTTIPLDATTPPPTDPTTDPSLDPNVEVPPTDEEEVVTDPSLDPTIPTEESQPPTEDVSAPTDEAFGDCVSNCEYKYQLTPSSPSYNETDYVYEDGNEDDGELEVVDENVEEAVYEYENSSDKDDKKVQWNETYYDDDRSYPIEEYELPSEADDYSYDPTKNHDSDVDSWMADYYGTGDWIEVDDKGASSYKDESTAVKYNSMEEMAAAANKMFKAWSPSVYVNSDYKKELTAPVPVTSDPEGSDDEVRILPVDDSLLSNEDQRVDPSLGDVDAEELTELAASVDV